MEMKVKVNYPIKAADIRKFTLYSQYFTVDLSKNPANGLCAYPGPSSAKLRLSDNQLLKISKSCSIMKNAAQIYFCPKQAVHPF